MPYSEIQQPQKSLPLAQKQHPCGPSSTPHVSESSARRSIGGKPRTKRRDVASWLCCVGLPRINDEERYLANAGCSREQAFWQLWAQSSERAPSGPLEQFFWAAGNTPQKGSIMW